MVKVSVILPIYNVAPYLEAAFDSILNQSLKEIEVIAVNDGSTDQSGDIIKQYQQRDSRIISFSQENKGQSAARNLALQHATGKYIYMMDSDDMLSSPDAFHKYVMTMQNRIRRISSSSTGIGLQMMVL